jgi:hypothetical protein
MEAVLQYFSRSPVKIGHEVSQSSDVVGAG